MIADELHDLAAALRKRGKHITIETAATVAPRDIECDLASLSPKLRNSVPDGRLPESWRATHERKRWQPSIIQEWIEKYQYQLKFVISVESDIEEVQQLLCELNSTIPPTKILLMPEGISSETIRARSGTLIEMCKRFGYRYCNRLHVQLFGNQRGT